MTRRNIKWGDFDMAAWKFLKHACMAEPDAYCNGRRYDVEEKKEDNLVLDQLRKEFPYVVAALEARRKAGGENNQRT